MRWNTVQLFQKLDGFFVALKGHVYKIVGNLCKRMHKCNFLSRLTNDLVAYILKIAVRESCMLLRECQTVDRNKFSQILSSVPVSTVEYVEE